MQTGIVTCFYPNRYAPFGAKKEKLNKNNSQLRWSKVNMTTLIND